MTLEAANADVARMLPLLIQEFNPGFQGPLPKIKPALRLLKDKVVGDLGQTLWILMGTMSLLLLMACANVANLMLVRTQSRRAELAVRSALGAGRAAIARVVLAEAAVVGLIGGLGGVALAYVGLPYLLSLGVDDLPQIMAVRIDPVVLLVAAATAVGATLIAAGVPLTQVAAAGTPHAEALRGTRSVSDGPGGLRTRQMLVVAQVATALVLLVGSGSDDPDVPRTASRRPRVSAIRTPCRRSCSRFPGPGRSVARRMPPIANGCSTRSGRCSIGSPRSAASSRSDSRRATTACRWTATGGRCRCIPYVDGVQVADGLARTWEIQNASPGLFETMQTRIVAGRGLTWDDVVTQRQVMLVSEGLARKEWGSPSCSARAAHQCPPFESRVRRSSASSRTCITTGSIRRRRR